MTYSQLTVLIPSHSLEDFPTELAEKPAASTLNAFAVLWHPRLIANAKTIPRWHRADAPEYAVSQETSEESESGEEASVELVVVPLPCTELLPSGWIEETRDAGGVVITGEHEREKMLEQALAPLGADDSMDPDLVADFLAFGTVYLLLELLTCRMRNFSNIDELHLNCEMLAAAEAAVNHDREAAQKRLTACFEMLLESRERFYPVECFLIDLCLVTPEMAKEQLAELLESSTAVNLLAPCRDWQTIVESEPAWKERIRNALNRQTLEIVGGDDVELESTLMSLDSILWHLRAGHAITQELFEMRPVTWGRKRYGIGSYLPQILDRLGYSGALHIVLDDGAYPDEEQSQMRWEGNDGNSIDAISRIPLAADGAAGIFRFPDRMSESMDMDHVAAVMFARWPQMRTPYLDDLRRAHQYAPILGTFVRFEDYFKHASGPGRLGVHRAGEYFSPALVHSVAAREADPVSRYVNYWEQQREFEKADWTTQMVRLLRNQFGPVPAAQQLETTVQAADPQADLEIRSQAGEAISAALAEGIKDLQALVTSGGETGAGVLVVNPLSFPRKVLVKWPSGTCPVNDANVLATQIENDHAWGLVSLPPCGFVWLAADDHPGRNTAPGKLPLAESLLLRTDQFEVRLSDVTGGIGAIQTYRRSPNRISQQVALRFPHEKLVNIDDGEERESFKTFYTSMQLREHRILSEGPLIGEIETLGDLLDQNSGELIATYRQNTRVVRGRPYVEVGLEIAPAQELQGNPWMNYIGCRFAWQHVEVALTGSMQQGAHAVVNQRIEAPHFLEIADDEYRTTLLFPGQPFHRKTGERMLDTVMLTEGENARIFRFAVAIDAKYPMQACLDEYSTPIVVPTQTRPSDGSRTGWFFGLSAANVQLTRILPSENPESVIVRLIETEGRSRVLGLQCFRTPRKARQVNFLGETITDLRIDDAVNIEISPYEICDVELTF